LKVVYAKHLIMPALQFENVFPAGLLTITGEAHLHEGPSGAAPGPVYNNTHFQTDQAIYVHFTWQQNVASWFLPIINPSCKFVMKAFFELMGAGESAANPTPVSVNFTSHSNASYSGIIFIPAGTLAPGVYRCVVCLQFDGPGGAPTPVAAFTDIGMLQVYQDR
jgi:hypothetical protein